MEVLIVHGGNKREVILPAGSDVLEILHEEFKKMVPNVKLGSPDTSNEDSSVVLQCFSKKWDTFVDVTKASDICNGDKLAICKRQLTKVRCDIE